MNTTANMIVVTVWTWLGILILMLLAAFGIGYWLGKRARKGDDHA